MSETSGNQIIASTNITDSCLYAYSVHMASDGGDDRDPVTKHYGFSKEQLIWGLHHMLDLAVRKNCIDLVGGSLVLLWDSAGAAVVEQLLVRMLQQQYPDLVISVILCDAYSCSSQLPKITVSCECEVVTPKDLPECILKTAVDRGMPLMYCGLFLQRAYLFKTDEDLAAQWEVNDAAYKAVRRHASRWGLAFKVSQWWSRDQPGSRLLCDKQASDAFMWSPLQKQRAMCCCH